jgi:hypothetical protein
MYVSTVDPVCIIFHTGFYAVVCLHFEEEERVAEEKSVHSEDGEKSQVSTGEEQERDKDIFEVIAEDKKHHGGVHVPNRSFNLIQNLEKIKCDRYAEALIKAGYEDEVG